MNNLSLFHIPTLLYLLSTLITSLATSPPPYTPQENIALSCGDQGNILTPDGRNWTGDISSKFLPTQDNQLSSSSTSSASTQDFAPQTPYMTARIFHSQFTYSFPLTAGPKFLRLHFHPAFYSNLTISNALFSVNVNSNYTLLRNFSASLTSRYLNTSYFVKEFSFNMVSDSTLNITLKPSSPHFFAFINGIEIVSMPTNLYVKGQDVSIVGENQPLTVGNSTALEMVYRLNVGGQAISPAIDTGMFRDWSDDVVYIDGAATGVNPYHFTLKMGYTKVPPYTAPEILYRTGRSMGTNRYINENYNLTWRFPVDSGFYYLVRLHFCEIAPQITGINRRVFQIFLNNQTADDEMDIMVYAGGIGIPIYRDFIVVVPDTGGKIDLWLALHPNTKVRAMYSDALLNGLEIFKLNNSEGSLAGPNPDLPDPKSDPIKPSFQVPDRSKKTRIAFIISGASLGGVILLVMVVLFVTCMRRAWGSSTSYGSRTRPRSQSGSDATRVGSLPSNLCRFFLLEEIKSATNDFSSALVIGAGGFGSVYKGYIDGGSSPVAIKRLSSTSQQGAHEFRTEIETLSQLRHVHLVSLIGYCEDHPEMILVYDYMPRGTLKEHLYDTVNSPLPWKLRLQICIGAARGLHYLHTGAKYTIIHRDVKTTNILLDENWMAKVSDFGLSKVWPTSLSDTHVSTVVKGSFGYLDPEYYRLQQLTEKSDVYSFGVVLFEVLCARSPLDKNLEKEEVCLSEWARAHYMNGTLDEIVDPYLRGKIAPECLRKFGEIATSCLDNRGIERPAMADVAWNLEFALELQKRAEESEACRGMDGEESLFCRSFVCDGTNVDRVTRNLDGNLVLGMSGEIFSEILNPRGR